MDSRAALLKLHPRFDSEQAYHSFLLVWVDPSAALRRLMPQFDSARGDQQIIAPVLADPSTGLRNLLVRFDSERGLRGVGGHSSRLSLISSAALVQHNPRNHAARWERCVSHKDAVRVRVSVLRRRKCPGRKSGLWSYKPEERGALPRRGTHHHAAARGDGTPGCLISIRLRVRLPARGLNNFCGTSMPAHTPARRAGPAGFDSLVPH